MAPDWEGGEEKTFKGPSSAGKGGEAGSMGRGVGGAVQKPSPGICLGSLLGSPQTRPSLHPTTTSVDCPQLLCRGWNVCIPVLLNALAFCSWRTGESAPASHHPRAGRGPDPNSPSALQCVGPSGHHELISFISPAGRMDFPPILRRRKLRTGESKPIAQVLQLRWAPTSSGGEGLP